MAKSAGLDLWQAGSLAKSININQPDFETEIQLTPNTSNVTSGIVEGIGPRYGFAPIPGHMDQEAPASGQFPGLMRYELGLTDAITADRTGAFAIYAQTFGGHDSGLNTLDTYYIYVISYIVPGGSGLTFYDVLVGSVVSGTTIRQSPLISSGLPFVGGDLGEALINLAAVSDDNAQGDLGTEMLSFLLGQAVTVYIGRNAQLFNLLTQINTNPYVGTASISITGPNVPMNWVFGGQISAPTSASTPALNLSKYYSSGQNVGVFLGYPSSMNYGNTQNTNRKIYIYCLDNDFAPPGSAFLDYVINYSTSLYSPTYVENKSNIAVNSEAATPTSYSGAGYASAANALVYDSALTCNASFQATLIAADKPIITLIQDWYRGNQGSLTQYIDPTNYATSPPQINNLTTFSFTAAGTGQLRSMTPYELSCSIYNKRLNFETNVCPNTFQFATSTDDFVGITLGCPVGKTMAEITLDNTFPTAIPFPGFGTSTYGEGSSPLHLNYLEYRFYYRAVGSQYWLPALFIDAAKFWFYPHFYTLGTDEGTGFLQLCTAAIGGVTGGTPGGLEDYSPLPQDKYNCAVMFKNRAFWLSNSSLVFSLTNNIFGYPSRNSAACPTGSFKGALVQAYYGQATQNSRLVIFSTKGTYVGQFTGNPLTEQVIISASSGPTVQPLDGSDFVIQAWTSVTAFSYRSAVVAEGLLFFWGPQGIFVDDGVNPINRISIPLEPSIFSFYDPSRTDEIHCEYNDTTKEIWWFYPTIGAGKSSGLCYNKLKNSWLYGEFNGQIDAVQTLAVENAETTAGSRLVAFSRQNDTTTVQRAYYFDQNNLAADIFPGQELMVKQVSTPSAGIRRLTLAAGHSTGTIAAGDLIALQQCPAYATSLSTPSDFVAIVNAVGSGTVDIILPTGATLDAAATITNNSQFFPIWHAAGTNGVITGLGINGFAWEIDTKFWVPGGMNYWAAWLYLHMVYKLFLLLPGPDPTMSFNHQTPISVGDQSSLITLLNNSANNFQILRGLIRGNQNAEGQGIKMTWSGIQLAGSWVLQFLEAQAQNLDGDQLMMFQG